MIIQYDIETSYFPDTFPIPEVKQKITPETQKIYEFFNKCK